MEAERLLQALGIPTLTVDVEGRVLHANLAAYRLLAWPTGALLGQPLAALLPLPVHTVGGVPIARWLGERARRDGDRPLRLPVLRKDGVCIEIECTQSAVPDHDSLTLLTLERRSESVDFTTERLGAHHETPKEQEQRYRQVFEHAPVGIWHFDARGVITACNDVFVGVIGSSRRLLVGLDMNTIKDERMKACVRGALAGQRMRYEGDYHSTTGDKVTPVRVDFAPIWAPDGTVVGGVGIVEDISERRRAEDERARMLAKEQAARRAAEETLRAREEFLSMASHELRTPLTSVRLSVDNLLELAGQGKLAEMPHALVQKSLQTSARQVRHLARLVDDLLDVSRIRAGRLELCLDELDLAEVVRGVVTRMEPQLVAAKCAVCLDTQPAPGPLDRSRIEQVVTNLLANALKFGAGAPIDVRVRSDGNTLTLEVQDRGIGIAPEEQARIFEQFERAVSARHYGGFGLGLFITRRLVEAHGGTIEVASEPGHGATFIVRLPASVVQ